MSNQLGEGFTDVARQREDPAPFFQVLDMQAANPTIIAMRRVGLAILQPKPGGRFLDVGSGTGEVARSIAERVSPGGSVIGIDASDVMVQEAIRRTGEGMPVEFRTGDALALDVAGDSMDGVHCERVLQHVADADRAFAELVRVAKPGGRIVVADTDWDTALLDSVDVAVERRMRQHLSDNFRNGTVGRGLRRMFIEAGLQNVACEGHVLMFDAWDPATGTGPPIHKETDAAVEDGALTRAEADQAVAALTAASERGVFFSAVTMFLVSGSKP